MSHCIALVTDLIFATRITGTAEKVGTGCQVVWSLETLQERLSAQPPLLVLIDLNADGGIGVEAVRVAKAAGPGTVLAFVSHVERDLAAAARSAGADEVLPRSAFVQRLPQLLSSVGGADAGSPVQGSGSNPES